MNDAGVKAGDGQSPSSRSRGSPSSFGPVHALTDVDFEVDRRRGRGAGRRQRRGQVHADQGDRRRPAGRLGEDVLRRGEASTSRTRRPPPGSASRPCSRTWRSATTSTWSPTSSWARRPAATGRSPGTCSTRPRWSSAPSSSSRELAVTTLGSVRTAGREPLGRAAPVGRDRALAGRRAQGGASRRADRRARRRPDRAGPEADPPPEGARSRRRGDQPQPRGRLRGGRSDRGPAARAAGSPPTKLRRRRPSRSSPRSPGRTRATEAPQKTEAPTEEGPDGSSDGYGRRRASRGAGAPGRVRTARARRARLASGADHDRRDLDDLPDRQRPLPLGDQPHQPDPCRSRPSGTISIGVVLVLLLGEIDLSVGAVSGLAAGVMAVLTSSTAGSPALAILAGLLTGHRDRALQRVHGDHLRHPFVRGDARGPARLAGRPAAGAGRHRDDQPPAAAMITDLTSTFYDAGVGWVLAVVVDGRPTFGTGLLRAARAARRRAWRTIPLAGIVIRTVLIGAAAFIVVASSARTAGSRWRR